MGGKYRITGGKYPRMRPARRRGRLAFLSVACATALGLLGWGTLQLIDVFTGGDQASAASAADCRPARAAGPSPSASPSPAVAVPKPGQITVNVYNATTRSGLAQQTADELKKRGFRIGEVTNAPEEFDKKLDGAGVLLGPAAADKAALPVLGTQLPGAEARTDAKREDATVDLIIGNGFKGLARPADADAALAELTAPRPTPTPVKKGC
ncbi:LytR C-terminal domain-containing protein [Streptomyces tagetis]|uniref:LytR C-terminal domain-containing protein n=1 Tax=Streptomyces tagetis TaxID=2820809 RepID=A0A940XN66_9ACTN|nr:LytR C-terminal domain-containing protein [Streptomyces sp. RG38]MBQ0827870.1 LytR C-terminal domain-containing protein [Streptomyces sp. RG38]